ncbi:hypothetical protein ABG067_006264, partial [Albugo candida]
MKVRDEGLLLVKHLSREFRSPSDEEKLILAQAKRFYFSIFAVDQTQGAPISILWRKSVEMIVMDDQLRRY